MLLFWVLAAILTFGVILFLLWPVLSADTGQAGDRTANGEAMAVYRDQLAELERDLDAGRLGKEDFEAARVEVQRRMLAVAPPAAADLPHHGAEQEAGAHPAGTVRRRRLAASILVIFCLPAGTLLTYVSVGSPGKPDLPLAARTDGAGTGTGRLAAIPPAGSGTAAGGLPDVAGMVSGLEEKLRENPGDADNWALLARSYMVMERYRDAVTAYDRALELVPEEPGLRSMRGEALVLAADGMVPPKAVADFEAVHLARPGEPRARYYLGLARNQAGDPAGALDWWIALEADTPAGASWGPLVAQRIEEAGAGAGIDVAALRAAIRAAMREGRPAASFAETSPPGPTGEDIEAAGRMSAGERAAMVRSMVERLAARLAEDPDDLEGWLRLARAYEVLGESGQARTAHANAARLAPGDIRIQLDYARALFPPGTPPEGITEEFAGLVAHIRDIAPENPDGLFYGGLVAIHQGDIAGARNLWSALLERMDEDAPVRGMLERQLQALGG